MAILQKTNLSARILLIILLAAGAWLVAFRVQVVNSDEAGIVVELPERVGEWTGEDIMFCPERTCGGVYMVSALDGATNCPVCGAPLSAMNWAEKSMLPEDTQMARKYYRSPNQPIPINVAIVLSGDDRSSIHRPEVCQTAAGNEIMHQEIIQIPLAERPGKPLEVMVMDMMMPGDPEAGTPPRYTFYAYWFVGKGRETASHWERYYWMTMDRITQGISHRWAYIAVYGPRRPGSDEHLQLIANFTSRLHPQLLKPDDEDVQAPDAAK